MVETAGQHCLVFIDIKTGPNSVLKIMAGQQTMSSLNGNLTGQKLHSPVMLTSHTDEQTANFVKHNYIHKLIENYKRIINWLFSQYFDRSETRLDQAKIYLAGLHVWPPSENYFEPWNSKYKFKLGSEALGNRTKNKTIHPLTSRDFFSLYFP